MADSSKMGGVIVTAVVGILVGAGVGYAIGNNNMDDVKSSETTSMSKSMSADSDGVTVGGAKMVATMDIVDNAANAKNVSTVVDLVKKANLVDTLKGTGPFTVFGPSNDAFAAVPEDILAKVSGSNDLLTTVLTYHVVPGTYTSADLRAMAAKGEMVKTVQGGMLSFKVVDNKVYIVDAANQQVEIETADVISSNGVTHVVKNVLLPVDPSTL